MQTPQLRAQFHKTVSTSHTSYKSKVSKLPTLLSNLAANLGASTIPSMGKLKNVETDAVLRKSLDLVVYYKGYNSGTPKWKRYSGPDVRGVTHSFHALWIYHATRTSMCPFTDCLSIFTTHLHHIHSLEVGGRGLRLPIL